MSGGHFSYDQNRIEYIIHEIERLIETNDDTERDRYGDQIGRGYSPEIIARFRESLPSLRRAFIYAQRIDWLVSCDDGPESFLRRLDAELKALDQAVDKG